MDDIPLKAIFLLAAYSAVHVLVYVLYLKNRGRDNLEMGEGAGMSASPVDTGGAPRRRATDGSGTQIRNRIIVTCLTLLGLLTMMGFLIAYH